MARPLGNPGPKRVLVPYPARLTTGLTVRVELFNNSCGYEGWEITVPRESGVLNVIGLGGGELAIIRAANELMDGRSAMMTLTA